MRLKAGSFNVFLEEQLKRSREQVSFGDPFFGDPFEILRLLRSAPEHSYPISRLMGDANISFTDFAERVNRLAGAGLVRVVGQPGDEKVEITDKGVEILNIMK